MPVDSPVFERTCEEIEQRTGLDRLTARGTVRIGLKAAGLDFSSVDARQMIATLRRVLPEELTSRGVEAAAALCEEVVAAIEDIDFEASGDRAGTAAATMTRFGT